MNFSLARATLIAEADLVGIAGERAVCDRRGVLYFPDLRLLCVSDLHLEKGSSFARRGALIPPYDTGATLLRLQAVIADYQPRIVISLGDSFHDGGGAGRMHLSFRERLEALMAGRDWFWVAGNHDPDAPADLPGEMVKELAVGSLLFRHEPSKLLRVEGEIAGHLHPCARIVQRGRSVRRRCFAGDGGRMIMPAFGAYTGSLNVLDRAYLGLFNRDTLMAYMLGAERVFAISGAMLRPG
ncbi:ligase-associated DNA damage response endonuclease PdeM [Mesorhizobium tamadayense]|uniref:Ligase-associated DNA damage response endonuclease PdeM n=1 Tax=Mesorhizobium tamadayense TaxID=425306 RepID=A0A3P3G8G5_9HYPH|nr:ligase-associated DNA damage response endonuclease PdeM [Mesorhizobium tamadayense]RRI06379.1 ligase-associated DNA damage response endonuclease PdeM [Mesorhizobium tamadayense]